MSARRSPPDRACRRCGAQVQPGTKHVRVGTAGVKLYCSAECMDASKVGVLEPSAVLPPSLAERPRGKAAKYVIIGIALASLSQWGTTVKLSSRDKRPSLMSRYMTGFTPVVSGEPMRPFIGPPAPSDEDLAMEFMGELSGDRWIHPLPGPVRRMPARDTRVFRAGRDHGSPSECGSGHCGIDIGGEMWGEQVFCIHDGVVDRVVREVTGRAGLYVRVAHRNGTVFSQYMHLAAIPRWIRPGAKVKAGDVVGLVGDTGVRDSFAHLHFSLSVLPNPGPGAKEIFMDPEPLIALWPLKIPRWGGAADAAFEPGVPRGAAGNRRAAAASPDRAEKKKKKKKDKDSSDEPAEAPADTAAAAPAEPATAPASGPSASNTP
ncbi:MAG TPA: M23 family metallopeptidase [Kofleriaceae bacterium]|nr:M23 family metallopeptidase [Kofleriaceae bacterium]